jgi:hypothetical protein
LRRLGTSSATSQYSPFTKRTKVAGTLETGQ